MYGHGYRHTWVLMSSSNTMRTYCIIYMLHTHEHIFLVYSCILIYWIRVYTCTSLAYHWLSVTHQLSIVGPAHFFDRSATPILILEYVRTSKMNLNRTRYDDSHDIQPNLWQEKLLSTLKLAALYNKKLLQYFPLALPLLAFFMDLFAPKCLSGEQIEKASRCKRNA